MFTYDASKVNLNVGTMTVKGFADGTFIKITRNTPENYKHKVGAKGEISRSKVTDNSATIEFTVKYTAPVNEKLYKLANSDGTFPVSVIEVGDQKFVASSSKAWIGKMPEISYGEEEQPMTWSITCADIKVSRKG